MSNNSSENPNGVKTNILVKQRQGGYEKTKSKELVRGGSPLEISVPLFDGKTMWVRVDNSDDADEIRVAGGADDDDEEKDKRGVEFELHKDSGKFHGRVIGCEQRRAGEYRRIQKKDGSYSVRAAGGTDDENEEERDGDRDGSDVDVDDTVGASLNDKEADGEKTEDEKADGKHADEGNEDGEKAEKGKEDGEKEDEGKGDKNKDRRKEDEENTDGEIEDSENSNGREEDCEKTCGGKKPEGNPFKKCYCNAQPFPKYDIVAIARRAMEEEFLPITKTLCDIQEKVRQLHVNEKKDCICNVALPTLLFRNQPCLCAKGPGKHNKKIKRDNNQCECGKKRCARRKKDDEENIVKVGCLPISSGRQIQNRQTIHTISNIPTEPRSKLNHGAHARSHARSAFYTGVVSHYMGKPQQSHPLSQCGCNSIDSLESLLQLQNNDPKKMECAQLKFKFPMRPGQPMMSDPDDATACLFEEESEQNFAKQSQVKSQSDSNTLTLKPCIDDNLKVRLKIKKKKKKRSSSKSSRESSESESSKSDRHRKRSSDSESSGCRRRRSKSKCKRKRKCRSSKTNI